MKLLTLSNYFNHHQKSLSDAFFRLLGNDYHFIETIGVPEFRKRLGYQEVTAPYVLRYNRETRLSIDMMIKEADVVIYGEAPISLVKKRYNNGKLTFRDDESRFKNPNRYLKWPIYTFKSHWINKGYLLCASAYAPFDYSLSGMCLKKCFKWGYYPKVKRYESVDVLMKKKEKEHSSGVSILWSGRLIGWKHPEFAVYVAEQLRNDGVDFTMNIIGTGYLEGMIKKMIRKKSLDNVIKLHGPMSPTEVRDHMEKSDIFLFTSDRCEGWGAVLNESMNSGCAVVADGNIGSVPYLIKDGENGIIYKSKNWKDLYKNVVFLATHHQERAQIGQKAYQTMVEMWNGETAAENFLKLSESIIKGYDNPNTSGPCSSATLIMRKWKGLIKTL